MTASSRLLLAAAMSLSSAAACASSTASSAASDSASSTVSSTSESLRGSSTSSSPGGRTAAGDFRIVEVAEVAERPGRARLTLEPVAGNASAPFTLELPHATLEAAALGAGDVIAAEQRPYGVAFATAAAGRARTVFFLVLDDDWHRELATRPVTL
jgi:hypothetical protein